MSFFILIIIPLVAYYVIFGTYADNSRNKELQLIRQLNTQAVDSIDLYINDISNLTVLPLHNEDILDIIKKINQDFDAFKLQRKQNFNGIGSTKGTGSDQLQA